MISLILRCALPQNASATQKRRIYGTVCGIAGITFNLLLFCAKLIVGTLSASIAVTADAFNNLSDATSSAVTLFGFLLASRRADREHPFGHGRIEYLSGIFISVLIIYVGIELLRSSAEKIFHPEETVFHPAVVIVLILSVCVKLYMAFYNRACGKQIHSETLTAACRDSLSDCISTLAVLAGATVSALTGLALDGYLGAAVSLLILYTGIRSVIDTASPLLGRAPDPKFVAEIERIVSENPETRGYHDLVVHDYGPAKVFVSLHMEVDGSRDIYELHDAVDSTEHRIAHELHCEAVIHMDPIDVHNPVIRVLYGQVHVLADEICPQAKIHDFRMVPGTTHTNLIFDLVLPAALFPKSREITDELRRRVRQLDGNYYAVIHAEISYAE